ncbi:hypothetical protein BB559_005909 [Furculomyces boomerangus]|uniref:ubiquitinyl hydrolase 1 n=1 Tax=Furculomyces boomerangus TaxID=61424 RepID=A0A2T9Y619_9FUNG|nr:hypothetical protein BB559_005909 [Furculomyces boomerangus]
MTDSNQNEGRASQLIKRFNALSMFPDSTRFSTSSSGNSSSTRTSRNLDDKNNNGRNSTNPESHSINSFDTIATDIFKSDQKDKTKIKSEPLNIFGSELSSSSNSIDTLPPKQSSTFSNFTFDTLKEISKGFRKNDSFPEKNEILKDDKNILFSNKNNSFQNSDNLQTDIISQLSTKAQIDPKTKASTKSWIATAKSCYEKGRVDEMRNNYKDAYVLYLRFCEIVLNIIPSQSDYKIHSKSLDYLDLKRNTESVMICMEPLKEKLKQIEIENKMIAQKTSNNVYNNVDDMISVFRKRYPSIKFGGDGDTQKNSNTHTKDSISFTEMDYLFEKQKKLIGMDEEFIKIENKNLSTKSNQADIGSINQSTISPKELFKIINGISVGTNQTVLIIDVRGDIDFLKCHIKYNDIVNIDPSWLSSNTTANQLSEKIMKNSLYQQEIFQKRDGFDKIVFMDNNTKSMRAVDNISLVMSSRVQTLRTLLLAIYYREVSSSLKKMPILLEGGIEGWIKECGWPNCEGADVLGFSLTHKPETNTQNYIGNDMTSTPSSNINEISGKKHLFKPKAKDRQKSIDTKRLGTVISPTDAALIAQTMDNVQAPSMFSHSRSLYDFFKRKESNDTSEKYHGQPSTAVETNSYSKDIENDLDTSKAGNYKDIIDESENPELYYVIGRRSDSIKNALMQGSMPSNDKESKAFRRKTIFDNPLLGFTNDSNSVYPNINESAHPKIKINDEHIQSPSSAQQVPSSPKKQYISELVQGDLNMPSGSKVEQRDIGSSNVTTLPKSLEQCPEPVAIAPTTNNFQNHNTENKPENQINMLLNNTPYIKPLPTIPVKPVGLTRINTSKPVHRSSSTGPQSSRAETYTDGPPVYDQRLNASNTYQNDNQNQTLLLGGELTNKQVAVNGRPASPIYGRPTANIALTGLKNFGNTCYINSVIQCLSATLPFARFFLTGGWRREVTSSRSIAGFKLEKGKRNTNILVPTTHEAKKMLKHRENVEILIFEFASVIEQIWSGQNSSLSPTSFVSAIRKCIPIFQGNEQQDAQEFASNFLNQLDDGLNTANDLELKRKRKLINQSGSMTTEQKQLLKRAEAEEERKFELLPDFEQSELKWKEHTGLHWSIIVSIFQGQLQSRLVCANCGYKSTTYSAFTELSIPIPLPTNKAKSSLSNKLVRNSANKNHTDSDTSRTQSRKYNKNYSNLTVDISDCLSKFVESETLDVGNEWLCPSCKNKSSATKTLKITKLPLVLTLHLKRFSYEGPFRNKLETMVTYPTRGLDMTPYCAFSNKSRSSGNSSNKNGSYHLYSVVNHMGGLSGGHYTASVYNGIRNEWNYFNDTRVSRISEPEVVSPAAYLLYFVRDHA